MVSFRSFKSISKNNIKIESIFKEKKEFKAHTHTQKQKETLQEHIYEVKDCFLRLVELNKIEKIIDNLIKSICFGSSAAGNHLKRMFLDSIVFHDFGKINPNFQTERMQNTIFFPQDKSIKIGSEHSFLSAYIFLNYHFNEIHNSSLTNENKSILWAYAFLFAIPIIKHHSGSINKDYDFEKDKIKSIHRFLEIFGNEITFEFSSSFFENEHKLWEYFDDKINNNNFDFFPLFALLKLNYSLLTASDYLATSHYMNDIELKSEEDFGLITNEFKKKLFVNFDKNDKAPWNGELIKNKEKYLHKSLDDLGEKSNENLNFIRQKLGAEVLTGIEKNKNEKVFYIEAPTGGGKTNMSMIAVRKMIELHTEINKVFYVFPFTTLITQTAKAIKETFGLENDQIAQVHSKSGFQEKEYRNEIDAKYGKEKRNQIDNLFVNYPFSLMTHIKFFDVLKSNKKDTNYLLHRLANSIVIIDELQAYNPEHWDKIKYFIAKYAELFNIQFIIMSATLPKIDEIELSGYKPKPFVSLISDAKNYLQNPNFAGRVKIKTNLLNKKIELSELANIVLEKSKKYAETRNDGYLGSVHTIIEFIFKKSASAFFRELQKCEDENGKFYDEIFVLSGTILEARRKYIIDFLKAPRNKNTKVLLITTQVVEAGVDIDMDLGFKNQSLIDSDEQLAGRINRNINKQNCELFLFKHDSPKRIYGDDLRYQETEKFDAKRIKDILSNKSFDELYKKVFAGIFKTNISAYKKGLDEYLDNFSRFDFKGIHHDFRLIDSQNVNIFVPIDIPVNGYSTKSFSDKEFEWITKNNCLENTNFVSGEKMWERYVSIIENKELEFTQKNYELKILNGIMSNFVFSVFIYKLSDLSEFIENPRTDESKFQLYYKLRKEGLSNIYTIEGGLNEEYLEIKSGQRFDFI